MQSTPLEMKKVCKFYGPTPAVCGLDLLLRQGEILTLLGPSGCGKTTTLRLIAGFERPDDGEILITGRMAAGRREWLTPEQRGVGMVFQDYALFPHLTVAQNVAFGLRKQSPSARAERVRQMLSLVGMGSMEERFPHNLSGGQQQRVALARALAPAPALVLLDEPFSNLDAALRVHMRDEVREILKESGATAIFVTHDQKDALAISDRVAVMNGGVMEQVGTPREIYQTPSTTFVAQFVGQTNLFEGEIGVQDPRVVVTAIGPIPCPPEHGYLPGTRVAISIRPDSFALDPAGPLTGLVRRAVYGGDAVEVDLETVGTGAAAPLVIHVPPHTLIEPGMLVRFRATSDHVAIIAERARPPLVGRTAPAPELSGGTQPCKLMIKY